MRSGTLASAVSCCWRAAPSSRSRRQRIGQLRGRAVLLMELREWRACQAPGSASTVGGRRDHAAQRRRRHRVHLVGHHHRRAGQRQLERHRARGGQRRARQLEGAELVLLAVRRDAAASANARQRLLDQAAHRLHDRNGDLELSAALAQPLSASRRTGCISRLTSDGRLPGSTTSRCASGGKTEALGPAARGRAPRSRPGARSADGRHRCRAGRRRRACASGSNGSSAST